MVSGSIAHWPKKSVLELIFYINVLSAGTREAAFTHAIMSAGVTHRITHACTLGNMSECNCDDRRKGQKSPKGWTWGGCSADVGFGESFAQKFMTQSGGHDRLVGLINAHNSQTGREVSYARFCFNYNDIIAFLIIYL